MGALNIPAVNLQALTAIAFFTGAVVISRMIANIYSGKWRATSVTLFYLRTLLGFLLAGAVVLGYYSFAGVNVARW